MSVIENLRRISSNLFKKISVDMATNRKYNRSNSHTHDIIHKHIEPLKEFHTFDIGKFILTVRTRYQDLKYVGKGSQGCVVEAFDSLTQQTVAIKRIICTPLMAKFAFREIYLMKQLDHMNIIHLIDAFTPANSAEDLVEYYIVMDKMDATMAELSKPLDHSHMSALIYQVLCGLYYLHSKGIIHRDVKPHNIGVMKTCQLSLLDFGLARSIPRQGRRMSMHMVTLHYRAPELLLGLDYDTTVDMWSVGCILAELISDRVLFRGTDEIDQLHKIVSVLGTPDNTLISQLSANTQEFFKLYKDDYQKSSIKDTFPDSAFKAEPDNTDMNDKARDLLEKLLQYDPKKRMTTTEALQHPYFEEYFTPEDLIVSNTNIPDYNINDFHTFEEKKLEIFNQLTH
ncbi:Mitogen-activated protein kinase 8-like isoform X3 [Oopsacas minuta]|uniref:Stress-activated protein kinase JNK n=1 Tax=Oopsacas minuta TaxID=111878 RepID=A0AAV7JL10_9METZ|nr:Mitogen-activated protein kinase 8-like isoform X3 [Oopsacas minuta]